MNNIILIREQNYFNYSHSFPFLTLNLFGDCAQPVALLLIEMGRKTVVDGGVVLVEPFYLLWRQQFRKDGCLVDGAERERLELQEATEVSLAIRLYQ